jgi:uncharacterized protein YgiM (DUF1202 family)
MSNRNRDYQNFYGKRAPQIDAAPVETKPIEVTEPQVEETPVPEVPEVPTEDTQPVESTVTKVVVKGAARVNVRAGHNKDSQVITVLPEGAEITFLDHTPDGWDRVMLKDGTEGYMMSKFLKRI